MPRPTLADHEARIQELEEAKLTDRELLTLRTLLKAETVRLQHHQDWAGPIDLWRRWTSWKRLGAIGAALAATLLLVNQILSFLDRFAPVAPSIVRH
jgi:hypothetical protein